MIDPQAIFRSVKFEFSNIDKRKVGGNEYLSVDHDGMLFVRDFCSSGVHVDIDDYYDESSAGLVRENANSNFNQLNASLDLRSFSGRGTVVIVSGKRDGSLGEIGRARFIGVNEALLNHGSELDIYLCNNPFASAIALLPRSLDTWPAGVFSLKTNKDFVKRYRGIRTGYNLPAIKGHGHVVNRKAHHFSLEDHRCPVLAAANLAAMLNPSRIVLSNVENYINEERPGTVYIADGIFMYPQQVVEFGILNAAVHWLEASGIEVFTEDARFDGIGEMRSKSAGDGTR